MAYRRLQNDRFVDDATGIVYEDRPGIGMVAVGDATGAALVTIHTPQPIEIFHGDVNEYLIPIGAFYVKDAEKLAIHMAVETNALDQFVIKYKYSPDDDYVTRVSTALNFTTPNAPVLAASGSWLTAAVGTGHWLHLDVSAVYAVQLWAASGNAAGSKIALNGVTQ